MWLRNPDDPTKPISSLVIIHDSEPSYSFPGVPTWFPNSHVLMRDHSTHLAAPTLGSLNTHVLTQFSRSTICPISNKIPPQSSSIPFLYTLSNLRSTSIPAFRISLQKPSDNQDPHYVLRCTEQRRATARPRVMVRQIRSRQHPVCTKRTKRQKDMTVLWVLWYFVQSPR